MAKSTTLKNIVFSFIIGVFVLAAALTAQLSLFNTYGVDNETKINQTELSALQDDIEVLQINVENESEHSFLGVELGNSLLGSYGTIKKLKAINSIRKNFFNLISTSLSWIPTWFKNLVFIIVAILGVIIFISIIRSGEGTH